jgi:hypothetical protein
MLNMKPDLALFNIEYSEQQINEEQKTLEADEEFAHHLNKYEDYVSCQHEGKVKSADGQEQNSQSQSTDDASHFGEVKSEQVTAKPIKQEDTEDFLAQINAAQQQSTLVHKHSEKDDPVTSSRLSQVAQAIEKTKQGVTHKDMSAVKTEPFQDSTSEQIVKDKVVASGNDDKQMVEAFATKQGVSDIKVGASKMDDGEHEEGKIKNTKSQSEGRAYVDSLLANKEHAQRGHINQYSQMASSAPNLEVQSKTTPDNVHFNKVMTPYHTVENKLPSDSDKANILVPRPDANDSELMQKVEKTLEGERGYSQLSSTDKQVLKSLLSDAVESGKLSKEGKVQAEMALQAMRQLDNETVDKTRSFDNKEQLFGESVDKRHEINSQSVSKKSDATQSPMSITKAEGDSPRSNEVKALQEQTLKEQQTFDEFLYKPEVVTTKVQMSSQVEQLFKAVIQPINAQANSAQVQSHSGVSEFNNTIQMFESLQNQSVHQNHQNMFSGKIMPDPEVQQAINMARNDVAKVLQEKVSMMLNLNNKQAEIRLDPPELGSMQIRIRSDAEQAQVNFVVQNQQAKEALEQSLPKLKEMLAEQGIELGDSNIQQENSGTGQEQSDNNQQQGHSKLANHNDEAQNSSQLVSSRSDDGSGIDYYA